MAARLCLGKQSNTARFSSYCDALRLPGRFRALNLTSCSGENGRAFNGQAFKPSTAKAVALKEFLERQDNEGQSDASNYSTITRGREFALAFGTLRTRLSMKRRPYRQDHCN